MIFFKRLDDQIIHRRPYRSAPVGVTAEEAGVGLARGVVDAVGVAVDFQLEGLVEVAELLPEVVAWNREHLAEVNGLLVDEPRVRMVLGDVFELMLKGEAERYDAILLDVDNGPVAMVQEGNGRMYQADGLATIGRVLKPGGCVAFWSASGDPAFVRRLVKAGFQVKVEAVKAYAQAKRKVHTIFLGRRK